jgi:hypothetical protein
VPFRKKYDDATIEAAAERRRAGASLRDLEVETGIPRSTLSRRIAAYERERATAVPPATERRGHQPERSDTQAAPPREVAEHQARAQLAARPRGTGEPLTMVWKDEERFAPSGFAFIFNAEDAARVFSGRRKFGQDSADQALSALAAAGLLYTNEADRYTVRVPKSLGWRGHDRVIAVPGHRKASSVARVAYLEWLKAWKPSAGGPLGAYITNRERVRDEAAAAPPDPRVRIIDYGGRERGTCPQSNAGNLARALGLTDGFFADPIEEPAAAPSSSHADA